MKINSKCCTFLCAKIWSGKYCCSALGNYGPCLKVNLILTFNLTYSSGLASYIILHYAIEPCTGSSKVSFAVVCIESIEKMLCSELTDEIAQIETYKTASELRSVQGFTNCLALNALMPIEVREQPRNGLVDPWLSSIEILS